MCYSNTEEQQRWKCVSLIKRSSSAGSVLFLYRGAASLEVCYSNTKEQHRLYCYSNTGEQYRWKCVSLIQGSSIAGSLLV